MKMKINYKPADYQDIEKVMEMMSEFYRHEKIDSDAVKIKTVLEEMIGNVNLGRIWLIKNYNENIGYLILTYGSSVEYGGRFALIDEFFIKEEFRNKGIGTAALRFVEVECKSMGIQTVHLQVKKFNPAAEKLYLRVGYEEIDRVFMKKNISEI